jgi:hypothetical protein
MRFIATHEPQVSPDPFVVLLPGVLVPRIGLQADTKQGELVGCRLENGFGHAGDKNLLLGRAAGWRHEVRQGPPTPRRRGACHSGERGVKPRPVHLDRGG